MCQEVWLLHCSANGLFMGREQVTRSGCMWIQNYYMNAFICAKAASLWALWHVRVCKYLLNLNLSPQLLVLWTRLEWEGGVGTLARKPVILYEIKKDRCLLRFFSREKKERFFLWFSWQIWLIRQHSRHLSGCSFCIHGGMLDALDVTWL